MVKEDLGLAILTSSAVFGAWSAWNSSLFTAATFVDDPSKYKHAKLAMDLGLLTAIATGAGVYMVYGKSGRAAAGAAVITGAALYLAYWMKLRKNPKLACVWNKNILPITNGNETEVQIRIL